MRILAFQGEPPAVFAAHPSKGAGSLPHGLVHKETPPLPTGSKEADSGGVWTVS